MTPTDRHFHAGPGSHHHDDPLYADNPHNEDVVHEHSDVNVRALLLFCVGLAVVVVVVHLSMYGLMMVFEGQAQANQPVLSPLAQPTGQLPPEPRLLTDEPGNLQRFRAEEAEALQGIEDAKRRLLQQGLPVRADAPTEPWMGTRASAYGEASGGRSIPVKPAVPGTGGTVAPGATTAPGTTTPGTTTPGAAAPGTPAKAAARPGGGGH